MPATPRSWRTPSRWRRRTAWRSARIAGFPDLWGFGRRVDPLFHRRDRAAGRLPDRRRAGARELCRPPHHPRQRPRHARRTSPRPTRTSPTRWRARSLRSIAISAALAIARSEQVRAAERAGLRVFSQIYADRAYTEEGTLVPRSQPGAVIHDADEAAARVVAMVEAGALITVSGAKLEDADRFRLRAWRYAGRGRGRAHRAAEARSRGRDRRAVRVGLRVSWPAAPSRFSWMPAKRRWWSSSAAPSSPPSTTACSRSTRRSESARCRAWWSWCRPSAR